MASKVFLDANIVLDFLLKRADYTEAKKVISLATEGKVRTYITPSIIQISGYWMAKSYGVDKAKELLLALLMDVTVIDISHEMTLIALNSKIDDIEDALQYYSSIHHKIDYFISRDKHLKKESLSILPVLTPKEFLALEDILPL